MPSLNQLLSPNLQVLREWLVYPAIWGSPLWTRCYSPHLQNTSLFELLLSKIFLANA